MMPNIQSILLGADAPRVLTSSMVAAVLSSDHRIPARNTVFRRIKTMEESGILRPVTRGLYINQLALPRPKLAEASSYIRSEAIVSLQTVLGDAGITNNYSDIVTCVVPIRKKTAPSSRPVLTETGEFRFHAMPIRLLDERAGDIEDTTDLEAKYPRATPEKALLDWIYLGISSHTKIAPPPKDIDLSRIDMPRLKRIAKNMELKEALEDYLRTKRTYDEDPEVDSNGSLIWGI